MRIAYDIARSLLFVEALAAGFHLDEIAQFLRIELRLNVQCLDEPGNYARSKFRVPSSDGEHVVAQRHLGTRELLYGSDVGIVVAEQSLYIYPFRDVDLVFHIVYLPLRNSFTALFTADPSALSLSSAIALFISTPMFFMLASTPSLSAISFTLALISSSPISSGR